MPGSYLHKNLRFLRRKNRWKQSEMMARCGISSNTWSNYENNVSRPGLEKIIELSKIFGVGIDDLLLKDLENSATEDKPQSVLYEEDSLTIWVILGQLKQMDAKIDQLLLLWQERSGTQD